MKCILWREPAFKLVVVLFLGLFVFAAVPSILLFQKSQETVKISESTPAQLSGEASLSQERTRAVVSRVIDGDTVELANGERVRLIGIDTPERDRPYFQEAKEKLTELIEGKEVVLEKDISEQDRYGRLLRYVWLGSVLINLEMVKQGYANSYTYPPDVKYQEEILQAEREARQKGIGLWSPTSLPTEEYPYVASRLREPFHYSWCQWAQRISEENKEYFRTREEAVKAGHRPCKVCNP